MKQVRSFFDHLGYLELDTPLLSRRSSIDTHIDLFRVDLGRESAYLISSPEYAMKRLLAQGVANCYQLSHVFRAGECSYKHNPEFCMVEWYRMSSHVSDESSFEALIKQTLDLIQIALGNTPIQRHEYWDLFTHFLHLDLVSLLKQSEHSAKKGIIDWLQNRGDQPPLFESDSLDDWLSYLMSEHVEPKLPTDQLHVIIHFPASQAALATTFQREGLQLARRFEIYSGTIELANGYHECNQKEEQRERLIKAQKERLQRGKDPLLLDERFLESLEQLPPCCGVALGFDRLLMQQVGATHIRQVMPFTWEDA